MPKLSLVATFNNIGEGDIKQIEKYIQVYFYKRTISEIVSRKHLFLITVSNP